jgi:hypothetical protein
MRIQSSSFGSYETCAIRVIRKCRLALYCALRARRVDLVGSGDLELGGPSVKDVKEGLLRTRNQ